MRQELVDVSIMLQLIDKNNFHVISSASSSTNMSHTAGLSAKVLLTLQYYTCTATGRDMYSHISIPTLTYTHLWMDTQGIYAKTPTFTHRDTDTHTLSYKGIFSRYTCTQKTCISIYTNLEGPTYHNPHPQSQTYVNEQLHIHVIIHKHTNTHTYFHLCKHAES